MIVVEDTTKESDSDRLLFEGQEDHVYSFFPTIADSCNEDYGTADATNADEDFTDFRVIVKNSYSKEIISFIPDFDGNLKKTIEIDLRFEDDIFYIECENLQISVAEDTREEAYDVFFDLIVNDFYNWLDANDEDLTNDAKEIKNKYLEYFNF